MMTPQQARRRKMMPSLLEDTMSMCGTSALKTAPPPATPIASPTHTHHESIQSETSTQDSLVLCSSVKQVRMLLTRLSVGIFHKHILSKIKNTKKKK